MCKGIYTPTSVCNKTSNDKQAKKDEEEGVRDPN